MADQYCILLLQFLKKGSIKSAGLINANHSFLCLAKDILNRTAGFCPWNYRESSVKFYLFLYDLIYPKGLVVLIPDFFIK